ncbi:MAG TPA: hypothetical protein VGF94_30290 [Kofleriaceae bacterium]|jgi:hypothetical protein
MSHLTDIAKRHLRDRWRDALFIGAAVLLTALSIGSVSSRAAGHGPDHQWSVTVIEHPELAK